MTSPIVDALRRAHGHRIRNHRVWLHRSLLSRSVIFKWARAGGVAATLARAAEPDTTASILLTFANEMQIATRRLDP